MEGNVPEVLFLDVGKMTAEREDASGKRLGRPEWHESCWKENEKAAA
jgi:hypothetical protein